MFCCTEPSGKALLETVWKRACTFKAHFPSDWMNHLSNCLSQAVEILREAQIHLLHWESFHWCFLLFLQLNILSMSDITDAKTASMLMLFSNKKLSGIFLPYNWKLIEFLFFRCLWTQKEKFHTHLAVLYLERVLSLISKSPKDEEKLNRARERLQALLRESNLYRVQYLLGESEDATLLKSLFLC